MRFAIGIGTALVTAAALTIGPLALAPVAEAAPAHNVATGTARMTVTGWTASSVTFDVGGGARPVRLAGGGVGVTDGSATSDALPTTVEVGGGRTVSGFWTIDDPDTVTFHFTADDSSPLRSKGGEVLRLSSDWGSEEWGHCVSGAGVAGAATGGFLGAISGPGAIAAATGGMLTGIIGGAVTC